MPPHIFSYKFFQSTWHIQSNCQTLKFFLALLFLYSLTLSRLLLNEIKLLSLLSLKVNSTVLQLLKKITSKYFLAKSTLKIPQVACLIINSNQCDIFQKHQCFFVLSILSLKKVFIFSHDQTTSNPNLLLNSFKKRLISFDNSFDLRC